MPLSYCKHSKQIKNITAAGIMIDPVKAAVKAEKKKEIKDEETIKQERKKLFQEYARF